MGEKLHVFKHGLQAVQQKYQPHFDETPPRYTRTVATLTEYVVVHYDERHVRLVVHPELPGVIARDTRWLFEQVFGAESETK